MATPVVPSQFAVGKNRIIHKPTTATFSFETGQTTFKSIKVRERHETPPIHHASRRRGCGVAARGARAAARKAGAHRIFVGKFAA
jgi:hypothetical protein